MCPRHVGQERAAAGRQLWRRATDPVRRLARRLWSRWRAYDERLHRDPRGRERSAMVVVGAVAGVALLGMVALLVAARASDKPLPPRATKTAARSTPTPGASPGRAATGPVSQSQSATMPAGGSLRVLHSGKCLAVPGDSQDSGVQFVQRTCEGGRAEAFQLVPVAGRARTFTLVGALTGRCVDIEGASDADGARTIQWDCHGSENQQFALQDVPGLDRYAQLVAVHSGSAWTSPASPPRTVPRCSSGRATHRRSRPRCGTSPGWSPADPRTGLRHPVSRRVASGHLHGVSGAGPHRRRNVLTPPRGSSGRRTRAAGTWPASRRGPLRWRRAQPVR